MRCIRVRRRRAREGGDVVDRRGRRGIARGRRRARARRERRSLARHDGARSNEDGRSVWCCPNESRARGRRWKRRRALQPDGRGAGARSRCGRRDVEENVAHVSVGEFGTEGAFEGAPRLDVFELAVAKARLRDERGVVFGGKTERGGGCELAVRVVECEGVLEEGVDLGLGAVVDFGAGAQTQRAENGATPVRKLAPNESALERAFEFGRQRVLVHFRKR